MTFATQLLEDLRATRSLRDAAPDAWGAFGDLYMGGGPAPVTAPRAWEVYDHYSARHHHHGDVEAPAQQGGGS